MNNFPNNPDFCLQWDWKNLRNLNCFVNIFCWFFFEVKKNSWQKFTSVEPQIYMFSQMWNSFMNINIHKYSPCSLSTDVLQHYISGKQLLAIVYTAFCSCYVIITDFFKVLTIKSWWRQLKNFFTMSCLMF